MPSGVRPSCCGSLQEGGVQRDGRDPQRKVDVRIVAATNRRPEQEVTEGRFREDLYYRLNVISDQPAAAARAAR